MRVRAITTLPVGVALILSFLLPGQASAATQYEGHSPYEFIGGVQCASDGEIVASADVLRSPDTVYGVVHLWWSPRCSTVWSTVHFNPSMDPGTWGIAYITVTTDNTVRNCDSPGGNKHVTPGQASCRTPMVDFWGPSTAIAQGHEYHQNSSGSWYIHATGKTEKW
ncbi:DUF2690 domain-containing protein [Streptomyces sp. LARHCF249]